VLFSITNLLKHIRTSLLNLEFAKIKETLPLVGYKLEIEQFQLALRNNTIKLDETVKWISKSKANVSKYNLSNTEYVRLVVINAFKTLFSTYTNVDIPEILALDIDRIITIKRKIQSLAIYKSLYKISLYIHRHYNVDANVLQLTYTDLYDDLHSEYCSFDYVISKFIDKFTTSKNVKQCIESSISTHPKSLRNMYTKRIIVSLFENSNNFDNNEMLLKHDINSLLNHIYNVYY
jgi:hypothetical protein